VSGDEHVAEMHTRFGAQSDLSLHDPPRGEAITHVFDVDEQANPTLQGKRTHDDPMSPDGGGSQVSSAPQTSPSPHKPIVPVKQGPPGEATGSHVPHVTVSIPPSSTNGSPVQTLLAH